MPEDLNFIHPIIAWILTLVVAVFPYWYRPTNKTRLFAIGNALFANGILCDLNPLLPVSHEIRLNIVRLGYFISAIAVYFFYRFLLDMAETNLEDHPIVRRYSQVLILFIVGINLTPYVLADIDESFLPQRDIAGPWFGAYAAAVVGVLAFPLLQHFRRCRQGLEKERMQSLYLIVATILAISILLIYLRNAYTAGTHVIQYYAYVGYACVLAYAVLAKQLFDITVIIRKTVEYSLITSILTLVYAGVSTMTGVIIGKVLDIHSHQGASSVAVIVVTLLFHPLRTSVQSWIDLKFHRNKVSETHSMAELTDQINQFLDANSIIRALLDILTDSFHPKRLAVYIHHPGNDYYECQTMDRDTTWPARMALQNPWMEALKEARAKTALPEDEKVRLAVSVVLPLRGMDRINGYLLIGEKSSDLPWTQEDLILLTNLLVPAGRALEQFWMPAARHTVTAPSEQIADATSTLVHEIKSPLGNISMPAQVTMMQLNELEKGKGSLEKSLPLFKKHLGFIINQAKKANDRIASISELATLGDQRLETIDLYQVLKESLKTVEPLMTTAGVHLWFSGQPGSAMVLANAKQLDMVFVNLIKNAIEAITMANRPATLRQLWLSILTEGPMHAVHVHDSGPGIDKDHLERLFQKYFTTKGAQGTGMGLYLCQKIIEAFHGRIEVQSEVGEGTTFKVYLPLARL